MVGAASFPKLLLRRIPKRRVYIQPLTTAAGNPVLQISRPLLHELLWLKEFYNETAEIYDKLAHPEVVWLILNH